MIEEELKLENQLCFPLYAASRLVTKAYKPLLIELNLTYPQYLVLLLLWEHKMLSVKSIGELLYLGSNTLTPLLKKMESKGLLLRKRSSRDERVVEIHLSDAAIELKDRAKCIPQKLLEGIEGDFGLEELLDLRKKLKRFIKLISVV